MSNYMKVGLYGPQGSGKTTSSARMIIGLYKEIQSTKPVEVVDTEDSFAYVLPLFRKEGIPVNVHRERTFEFLKEWMLKIPGHTDIALVDSISHPWRDLMESYQTKHELARLQIHHWGILKPIWRKGFSDPFLVLPIHFFICGRAQDIWINIENEQGQMEGVPSGLTRMAVEKEMGYEPHLLIEMESERSRIAEALKGRGKKAKPLTRESFVNIISLVVKDRSGTINGQKFTNPTWADFQPVWETTRSLETMTPTDVTKDSSGIFHPDTGRPEWQVEQKLKAVKLEEIEAELVKVFPATAGHDKVMKILILEEIFATPSWTSIVDMSVSRVTDGLMALKDLLADTQKLTFLEGRAKARGKREDAPEK